MSKIAVIKTGGKQYKVAEGQVVKIEKLDLEVEKGIQFDTLLVADGANINVGVPFLSEKVSATVIEHGKSDKVYGVKYKNKTRYRKTVNHRQQYTKVRIDKI